MGCNTLHTCRIHRAAQAIAVYEIVLLTVPASPRGSWTSCGIPAITTLDGSLHGSHLSVRTAHTTRRRLLIRTVKFKSRKMHSLDSVLYCDVNGYNTLWKGIERFRGAMHRSDR